MHVFEEFMKPTALKYRQKCKDVGKQTYSPLLVFL